MNNTLQLLGYALIPAVTMTLAGFWAIWRAPSANTRSALMHFAAVGFTHLRVDKTARRFRFQALRVT